MPKIITMDELVRYFEENNLVSFSEKESGSSMIVSIPAKFELQESDDYTLFATIRAWHTGNNYNGYNAPEKASRKAMKKLAYKPVLANFTNVNGEWDFTSHDTAVDNDGNVIYLERQIGCFTADAPYIQHDDEYDKDYIYARVAIPREYTDAAEIIERKQGTKVSVEMDVHEMTYSTIEKSLMLNDFDIVGVTCLGVDPDTGEEVGEGMKGSRIEFHSEQEPIMFSKQEIRKLKKLLESYNSKEGGNSEMNKFEELLAQYGKTAEEVTFEYAEMSDEELEAKFAEVFGEQSPSEEEKPNEEASTEEPTTEETEPEAEFSGETKTEPVTEEPVGTEQPAAEESAPEVEQTTFSVQHKDVTHTFALTLNEKLMALYDLINSTYADMDGDWYSVDADEEKKVVIFHGYLKSYRQTYALRKGEYSLVGDRVEIHPIWVTEDEDKQIQEKLNLFDENHNALTEAKNTIAKYEAEPDKVALLEKECYAPIATSVEFAELKEQKNHFDLSVDEVQAKADEMLLNFAKTGKIDFSQVASQPKLYGDPGKDHSEKRGRYGGIFRKKN